MFDLTPIKLDELLKVGQACGIGGVVDLWIVAKRKNIVTGNALINYIYACASLCIAA